MYRSRIAVRNDNQFHSKSLSVTAGQVRTGSPFTLASTQRMERQSEQKKPDSKVWSPIQSRPHGLVVDSSEAVVRGGSPLDTVKHRTCETVTSQKASVPLVLYRRPLPESCIAFASDEGKKIFMEALTTGTVSYYQDPKQKCRLA